MKQILLAFSFMAVASSAYAGLWDDSKQVAADAWQKVKETSVDLKDSAVDKWHEVKEEMNSSGSSEETGSFSDIKKLGDKETYVKAWQEIKESAKNPSEPNVDENGVPK
ncbi:hypothetical protein THMIRHAM_13410 [Thiomicrorhabdus immobilis]|uniref:Uncharacterized protein n=1 Tax=Thiomicrorhabdus immobilis TaxID=2791037 RepID=A0ABN6CWU3_9GAMM|nr:hypothetical protein [Thiomicrorhabdus immobilis]BCN93556.1 hypothetical protein THMIRHAM_13410 [Thiomicrorhabdus immobilis]